MYDREVWRTFLSYKNRQGAKGDRNMKRVADKPYFTYSVYPALTSELNLNVKCPKCHGFGIITAQRNTALFRCTNCGYRKEKERTRYRYDVHNQCKSCGRYYRIDIQDTDKQHFPVLHVACPFCKTIMPGKVHKTPEAFYCFGDIKNGYEPFFGLELWFLSSFQNKPVWALNRHHLAYLIDYLSADLRERPAGYQVKKTQADHLPAFMKTAKNRERIVRVLKKMQ